MELNEERKGYDVCERDKNSLIQKEKRNKKERKNREANTIKRSYS